MHRRLLAALITVLTATGVLSAASASASSSTFDFTPIVALSNCSGAIIRLEQSLPDDPALVLSNGHCLEEGAPTGDTVIFDKPSQRTFSLLTKDGQATAGQVQAKKIVYATMKDTDAALYQLTASYAQLKQTYGITGLTVADTHPVTGSAIDIPSGYWKTLYSCTISDFIPELRESTWTWKDSIRYSPECKTIGGTSGSPIVDRASGKVIGINNTGSDEGQQCTLNNPCEVGTNGQIVAFKGINYGQQTYLFSTCLAGRSEFDLRRPGCALPKPVG